MLNGIIMYECFYELNIAVIISMLCLENDRDVSAYSRGKCLLSRMCVFYVFKTEYKRLMHR